MDRFDLMKFAGLVDAALRKRGSANVLADYPGINKAMLSRARNGKPISVGNYLALCLVLDIDVWQCYNFASAKNSPNDQAVTPHVSRETLP